MRRYIVTGAPGCGKTAIIRQLELDGYDVVEEAATDVIAAAQASGVAEPWRDASFIDGVTRLQRKRLLRAPQSGDVQFHDRSIICTAALAVYLGYEFSPTLKREIERVRNEGTYDNSVFFVRSLGFITPTDARRITFEESLRFEKIHEDVYTQFGFELISIPAGTLQERVRTIEAAIGAPK
jgi:predicted ATPase